MHYYETATQGEIQSHDTLDEAIAFAEANGCDFIYEIGGSYTEYQKCWFCEEWIDVTDIIGTGVCTKCDMAFKSKGE